MLKQKVKKKQSKTAILPLTLPDKVHSSPRPTGLNKSPSKKKIESPRADKMKDADLKADRILNNNASVERKLNQSPTG